MIFSGKPTPVNKLTCIAYDRCRHSGAKGVLTMEKRDFLDLLASEIAEACKPDRPNEGSHPERITALSAVGTLERLRAGNEQYKDLNS